MSVGMWSLIFLAHENPHDIIVGRLILTGSLRSWRYGKETAPEEERSLAFLSYRSLQSENK